MIFFLISNPPPTRAVYWLTAIGLLLSALPGQSQSVRSAQWYARNHAARAEMVERCNNHPGPAQRSDDCAAAWQGNIIAAQEEARRHAADSIPPADPRYWEQNPGQRREIQTRCAGLPEEQRRASMLCNMARRT